MAPKLTIGVGRPTIEIEGDMYLDQSTGIAYTYIGAGGWVYTPISSISDQEALIPTKEQLEKHPTLNEAWNQYLIIKRLLGI